MRAVSREGALDNVRIKEVTGNEARQLHITFLDKLNGMDSTFRIRFKSILVELQLGFKISGLS